MDNAESSANRPAHQFKPGNNANPGGRPKVPEEIKEAFRKLTPTAIRVLTEILNDSEAKHADRLKAVETVLDRSLGKAVQQIEGEMNFDITITPAPKHED
jgi:hypothetical protein